MQESTIMDSDLVISMEGAADAVKPREPWPNGTLASLEVVEAGDESNGTAVQGERAVYLPLTLTATNADGDTRTIYHKQSLYPIKDPSDKRKASFKRMAARFFQAFGIADAGNMSALYGSLVRQEPGAAQSLVGLRTTDAIRASLKVGTTNTGRKRQEIDKFVHANGRIDG